MGREIRRMGLMLGCVAAASCATTGASTSEVAQVDRFRKCASTFETVYAEHREHEKADSLLWNAAQCHAAAGEHASALVAYDLLVSRFPDSEHAEKARAALR